MIRPVSAPTITEPGAIPASLLNLCFALFVINAVFFPTAFFAHWWIFDEKDLRIPPHFVTACAAGNLVLDAPPAHAYDCNIHRHATVPALARSNRGNSA